MLVRLSILVALPTIVSLGARWFWMLDLATHFRVQYACAALPLVVACLVGRWYWLALLPGAVLLLNLGLVLPVYLPAEQDPSGGRAIRAVSANVHTGNRSYERFLDYVRSEGPDIVVAVEIDQDWAASLEVLEEDYPYTVVQPRADNFGIALYSRFPIRDYEVVELADSEVPTIVARLEAEERTVTVIGTHPLPPVSAEYSGYRNRHLRALADRLQRRPGRSSFWET
jgi:endonuclease/exonuclease/phosphatase (EEP) superfamily protein YafD